MPSIVVYYKPQPDPDIFEKRYLEEHIPLVGEWQGVTSYRFAKVTQSVMGDFGYSHIFVADFDSDEAMKAHMTSEAMKKAVGHASEIAPSGFHAITIDTLA